MDADSKKRQTRRVAVLMREGKEVQKVCDDQDAAIRWLQTEMRSGDEFVCIESEHLNARRRSTKFR
jgi:hypothetical protein